MTLRDRRIFRHVENITRRFWGVFVTFPGSNPRGREKRVENHEGPNERAGDKNARFRGSGFLCEIFRK